MDSTTDLLDKQTLDRITPVRGFKQQDARAVQARRRRVLVLWVMGFLALVVASVIVRFHPAPWPFDLQTTITLQHLQPQLPFWVSTPIVWASLVDNVLPSMISFSVSFVVLALIGVVIWRRGGSPTPWFVTAVFISLVAGALNGMDGIIGILVSRPRPSSQLIHVFMPVAVHSFPSGHVENDVVFLGFILYLSLSKPVSRWRYRWVLIPLQLYAVLNVLLIGYSRVVEGSHWLTDVLGGYLSGALLLVLLIFLYRWTLNRVTKWQAKGQQEQSAEKEHTVEKKFPAAVRSVERYVNPYQQLLIKCKQDWIHHLAQALSFSYLAFLIPSTILVVGIIGVIQGTFDTHLRLILTGNRAGVPSQLSTFSDQILDNAIGLFAHGSVMVICLTLVFAILFGSLFFSLLEMCFDVIYHLPPRPFLRRHLVAIVMLFLFLVLSLISFAVTVAPGFFLSLLHIVQPGDTPARNLILRLAGLVASMIIWMITYEAIYVMIPHRHITFRTLGHQMRESWRGAAMATVVTLLFVLLLPLYSTYFQGSSLGQVAFIGILIVYLYTSMLILLFGAEVNAFFAEGIRVPQNDLVTQASRDGYR